MTLPLEMFPRTGMLAVLLVELWLLVIVKARTLKPLSGTTPAELEIWDYSSDKVRGISLGGWFVLEPYITPSLFEQFGKNESEIPTDEYWFCAKLGTEEAQRQLEKHWAEYYTEQDFKDIKSYGLNLVRIAVGYWAFQKLPDDPYVQGQEKFVDQAIKWAKENDLNVWIDLHGVPGSQNGFDNSGKRGKVGWFDQEINLKVTMKALEYIFQKYGDASLADTITGIEIVNEPMIPSLNESKVLQFTYDSYYHFREKYGSENWFVVQEGFEPIGYWNHHLNDNFSNISLSYTTCKNISNVTLNDQQFSGIVIDHHHYEVFSSSQLEKSAVERVEGIISYANAIQEEQKFHPSLVGEWSGAITDCARWLNGVGTGARYDNTFSPDQLIREEKSKTAFKSRFAQKTRTCSNVREYSQMSPEHRDDIREFIEVQLLSYEMDSAGWIFWNYKTENAIEWDFKRLVDHQLFPYPFDDYKFFSPNGTFTPARFSGAPKKSVGFWYLFVSLVTFAALC